MKTQEIKRRLNGLGFKSRYSELLSQHVMNVKVDSQGDVQVRFDEENEDAVFSTTYWRRLADGDEEMLGDVCTSTYEDAVAKAGLLIRKVRHQQKINNRGANK